MILISSTRYTLIMFYLHMLTDLAAQMEQLGPRADLIAGTRSVKTLLTALSVLLDDPAENHLSIVISLLKPLQISIPSDCSPFTYWANSDLPSKMIHSETRYGGECV